MSPASHVDAATQSGHHRTPTAHNHSAQGQSLERGTPAGGLLPPAGCRCCGRRPGRPRLHGAPGAPGNALRPRRGPPPHHRAGPDRRHAGDHPRGRPAAGRGRRADRRPDFHGVRARGADPLRGAQLHVCAAAELQTLGPRPRAHPFHCLVRRPAPGHGPGQLRRSRSAKPTTATAAPSPRKTSCCASAPRPTGCRPSRTRSSSPVRCGLSTPALGRALAARRPPCSAASPLPGVFGNRLSRGHQR